MTKVFGQPTEFVDDALAGFCDLNAEFVRPVTGGVVRSTASAPEKVAVVVGGGIRALPPPSPATSDPGSQTAP